MAQRDLFRSPPRPWNSGRIIGPKPPFKPKHVWAIRQQLKTAGRTRDLALLDCGIDAKLRGCDLVKLRVSDVAPGESLRQRATVIQQKTVAPLARAPANSPSRRQRTRQGPALRNQHRQGRRPRSETRAPNCGIGRAGGAFQLRVQQRALKRDGTDTGKL